MNVGGLTLPIEQRGRGKTGTRTIIRTPVRAPRPPLVSDRHRLVFLSGCSKPLASPTPSSARAFPTPTLLRHSICGSELKFALTHVRQKFQYSKWYLSVKHAPARSIGSIQFCMRNSPTPPDFDDTLPVADARSKPVSALTQNACRGLAAWLTQTRPKAKASRGGHVTRS